MHNDSQPDRAEQNSVSRRTQIKLDRLAADRPDLLERVQSGELKVHTAAKLAGIVKQVSQVEIAQRAFIKMSDEERNEFLSWVYGDD